MENLAREGVFGLTLVFGYTLGAFLLLSSLLLLRDEHRDSGIALIRFLGGLVLIVALPVLHLTESSNLFPIHDLSVVWSVLAIAATVIFTVVLSVGIGEFATYRISTVIDSILVLTGQSAVQNRFVSRFITYGGTLAAITVSVVMVLVILPEIKIELREESPLPPRVRQTPEIEVILDATYSLPGSPMAMAFGGEYDGYISLGQGEILRFELPQGSSSELQSHVVADNIASPRGLTILDDVLYVVDLGPLPCPEIRCKGTSFPGMDIFEGQSKIIKESNGSVIAFNILEDGDLGNKRTILTGLPASNFQHGANGIIAGPDGLLYLSIGGIDTPPIIDQTEGPNLDLMGTVIRFKPDGSELEIFAKGLRNVYELTFDDQGLLWGVDNDGPSRNGWRREEVLQIKHGASYGYPEEATFGPQQIRDDNPVWVLDAFGSAGIEWAGNLGLGPGLVVGTCTQLYFLALADYETGRFIEDRKDVFVLSAIPGCSTTVVPSPQQKMMVGVFDTNQLHQFTLVIDQPQ